MEERGKADRPSCGVELVVDSALTHTHTHATSVHLGTTSSKAAQRQRRAPLY